MKLYRLTQQAVAGLLRLTCRPVITGQERFPRTGPVVVASNHRALIDSIIISALMPRRVSFIAKASLVNAPGARGRAMGFVYAVLGIIPVDRSGQRESVAALDPALELLRRGQVFGVFPEGTRSRDGRLYKGHTGAAFAALTTGAPIVPVALKGTERMQKQGSWLIRPRRFELHIGQPIPVEQVTGRQTGRQRRELTEQVMEQIAELSGQERVDVHNRPPNLERDARRG